jgi:hypothetical protein
MGLGDNELRQLQDTMLENQKAGNVIQGTKRNRQNHCQA